MPQEQGVQRHFSLHPMEDACSLTFAVGGIVSRTRQELTVRFEVRGELAEISVPPPAEKKERRHNLWRETCFEVFFRRQQEKAYRELNLSPAGHWNAYFFDDCRLGMRQDTEIYDLQSSFRRESSRLELTLSVDLAGLGMVDSPLQLGLSTVILSNLGVTYWALSHCGPQPDFHNRKAWLFLV